MFSCSAEYTPSSYAKKSASSMPTQKKKGAKSKGTKSGDQTEHQSSSSSNEKPSSKLSAAQSHERTSDSPETSQLKPDTKVKKEDPEYSAVSLPDSSTHTGEGTHLESEVSPPEASLTDSKQSPATAMVPAAHTPNDTQPSSSEDRLDTRPSTLTSSSASQTSQHKETEKGPVKTKPRKIKSGRQRGGVKKEKDDQTQTQVTDYFPVRRSTRKCKSLIESEKFEEVASKVRRNCEDGLEIINDEIKGRGVVSTIPRKKDDFICEYSGELISYEVAKEREEEYSDDSKVGCYMYYFEHKNTKYCVDATDDDGSMGRLLNHSKTQANVTTKLYEVDGLPHLCLVALTDIEPNMELLYDYGERSKAAIESHPWLTS